MRLLAIAVAIWVAAGGSALAASKTYEVSGFTALEVSTGISARVEVGPAQAVRAESADEGNLDDLVIEVRDGKLRARIEQDLLDLFRLGDNRITLIVSVPELDSAATGSGAQIEVTGISGATVTLAASSGSGIHARAAAGSRFRIDVSSGARVEVEGACATALMEVSAGGSLEAAHLECSDVEVSVSSGGSANVFAASSVRAKASSGAHIVVYGNPASVQQESGVGGQVEIRR